MAIEPHSGAGLIISGALAARLVRLHEISLLRKQIHSWRAAGLSIAAVPTMGNLHSGHASLVEIAKQRADRVIASIFVNPTQFGPNEDFSSYPRTLDADCSLLHSVGCDAVFAPSASEMYPDLALAGAASALCSVDPGPLATQLCGAFRPGHFAGVATVVAKLFNLIQPDVAVFGEKDFQQLMVIRKLVRDLDFPVAIIGAPTVREANGLAKSSRNQYLSPAERESAALIYRTLAAMRDGILAGFSAPEVQAQAEQSLRAAGYLPDYACVLDAADLTPLKSAQALEQPRSEEAVALIAVRVGKARLIDNLSFQLPVARFTV